MNTTSSAAFSAAERLLKSADSLDSALAQDSNKKASFAPSRQGFLHDFGSLDTVFGSTDLSATLFDDWLSGDLQQAGFLSQQQHQEDSSSSSASDSDNSHSPVLSEQDSPALGFDSITSDADLIHSPGFDTATMGFFPDIPNPSPVRLFGNTPAPAAPMMPLTAESVQQAAAALNIPWSKGLEEAVLAQSLLASFPMALAMSAPVAPAAPAPVAPAPLARTTSLPPLMPKHGASMTVAHMPDTAMDSPPSTPSSTPMSPLSPMAHTMPLSEVSTPRMSLSILSSTQTSLPLVAANGASTIKATTYKSTYRSASLLKRDREFDEPPSVLEGRDIAEMDEVSLKRAKNTDAARRSRRKKLIKMESLEQRVAELEVENSMFETKLNEVELERSLLADKDQMQQARIQELEAILNSLREKMY
ncbi:hypothetical protein BG006_008897 [Podila minutissima]|uniref:BZIP domain-containing protein n=1 Tax=Podila minutissima TaxID=64525 RepID=A0A9P5SFA7_9FUNG|nr:hypothetical protein BG006_008897 [Podila minutissima]